MDANNTRRSKWPRSLFLASVILIGGWSLSADARGGSHGHSSGATGYHSVRPYVTKKGKVVPGHMQTNPNGTKLDNWSTKGNVNPFTGKPGALGGSLSGVNMSPLEGFHICQPESSSATSHRGRAGGLPEEGNQHRALLVPK